MPRTLVLVFAAALFASAPAAADHPADWRQSKFVATGIDVGQALEKLARESRVTIELADGVKAAHAADLARPVSLQVSGSTVYEIVGYLLRGTELIHVRSKRSIVVRSARRKAGKGAGAAGALGPKAAGGPDAVLAVELLERGGLSYGGMEGAVYWLRVREVLRFDRWTGKLSAQYRSYPGEFEKLRNRAAALDQFYKLDMHVQGAAGDAATAKRVKALDALLRPGKRFLLCQSTTVGFSTMGTVDEHKWGTARSLGTHFFADTPANRKAIDTLFAARRKQFPGQELDPTQDLFPPRSPRQPAPPGAK